MNAQPLLGFAGWVPVLDGHPVGVEIYERHYSARKSLATRRSRGTRQFGGMGERMVLLLADETALFVWRRQAFRLDLQRGVECSVFRSEGCGVASDLILKAEHLAWGRWPGERLFTFVDPEEVRGNPPGNCFYRAGWRRCGTTLRGLHVLEKCA